MTTRGEDKRSAGSEPTASNQAQEQVSSLFEERSGYWSDLYREKHVLAKIYQQRHAVSLSFFDELKLPPTARILELGCGAGWLSIDIARRGYSVDATDPAEAMLSTTAEHAKGAGVAERVHVQIADLHQLRFADQTFDAVLALGVITWLHDPARGLKELHRVMKPDGHAILTVNNLYRLSEILDPLRSPPLRPLLEGLKKVLAAMRLRKLNTAPRPHSYSFNRLDEMLAHAGLRVVRDAKFGYGPLTLLNRNIMSEEREIRLNEKLQKRADGGNRLLQSLAAQRVVVVRAVR